ncbi:MAG: Glycerophosphoryl diester phosphodiesterase [Candidatus Amesbacteria bacterium GW2011_GWC1_47_15]|uniref:Glycerophosphoryl diester phosphodiesterase n=2 Tax=Candidatus Amesiibacteriota TaxID=1752730 RepID=A0A0G1S4I0_9BACT|nr:MAG: Glycerophosphoryl diester phosphodiesterase [Candidatus Amesbacteria bacterium GW2011_GWC1_47_15]
MSEPTEPQPEIEGGRAAEQIVPNLKSLLRVILARTKTYTKDEMDSLSGSERMVRNRRNFEIIAHQGGKGDFPAHTREAYLLAKKNGAGGFDMDIRMSADGGMYCFHGNSLEESSDGTGKFEDKTSGEIDNLDAGYKFSPDGGKTFPYRDKGLKIARLADILRDEDFKDMTFYIHYQDQIAGTMDRLVEDVNEFGVAPRLVVVGFDEKPLIELKKRTGCRRGAGALESLKFMEAVKSGKTLKKEDLRWDVLTIGGEETDSEKPMDKYGSQAMTWARKNKLPDIDYVLACKNLGKKAIVWTEDDVDRAKKLAALGFDGIWTNFPSKMAPVINLPVAEPVSPATELATNLVNAMADGILALWAVQAMQKRKIPLTPEGIDAQMRRMEFDYIKGSPKERKRMEEGLQLVLEWYMQKDAPPVDPGLEQLVMHAVELTNK